MLELEYTPSFNRDTKRLRKRHVNLEPLKDVMRLILKNTPEALAELARRHNMHTRKGEWRDSSECHVANTGDWLLVWATTEELAIFQRTGSHDEIFGS